MDREDRLQVGVISSTHGIKGEVKVFPTTNDAKRFQKLKKVLLDTGKEELELEITGVKFFKQMVILKFKGIDSINDIEQYKGKSLCVTRENAIPCSKDEYFIADLIGILVETEDGKRFGELIDVLETGANDVYVVKTEAEQEVLLPAIKECVLKIDIKASKMIVHIMDGLL